MSDYKGLIPGPQSDLQVDTAHWKFGIIRNGIKIVDPQLHYTSFPMGYDDHGIIDRVCEKLKLYKPEVGDNLFKAFEPTLNTPHMQLTEKLYDMSGGYRSVFALSGSDAMEAGIKMAFAHEQKTGGHRKKIVSFTDAYHGATLMTLSVGSVGIEEGFYGMTKYPEVIKVSPDMHESVDWNTVCCIVVETCPHVMSIAPYHNDVWTKIKQVQQQHGVQVIVDDIFMGGGKTGSFFGFDQLPVDPDIIIMGKAITGGYFPLSIAMYNQKLHEVLKDQSWMHGHTYSFSLSGVLSMLEYIDVLYAKKYMDNMDNIVQRARKIFVQHDVEVVGNYGVIFMIGISGSWLRFALPINADDEYFDALPNTIQALKDRHTSELAEALISN